MHCTGEKWLRGLEHWLFSQSAGVGFPAPTQQLPTACNSSSRDPVSSSSFQGHHTHTQVLPVCQSPKYTTFLRRKMAWMISHSSQTYEVDESSEFRGWTQSMEVFLLTSYPIPCDKMVFHTSSVQTRFISVWWMLPHAIWPCYAYIIQLV